MRAALTMILHTISKFPFICFVIAFFIGCGQISGSCTRIETAMVPELYFTSLLDENRYDHQYAVSTDTEGTKNESSVCIMECNQNL